MRRDRLIDNFMTWLPGRQESGYDKLLLCANPFLVPFDLYVLRYPTGSEIKPHKDPVQGKKHYRLNVELWKADKGGEFTCKDPIVALPRIKLFRPDMSAHSVSKIESGKRYVLSLGWVRQ